MSDSSLAIILLGVLTGCLVAITFTIWLTARELRQTLRHVNRVFPQADRALREARRSLHGVHEILTRANRSAHDVERVIRRACETVSGVLERVAAFPHRAQEFLSGQFGNGAGAEPRQHHRRHQ
ncbi:MAG: hypothetical protein HYZ91_06280 [Candidatus Omnitrophica bacterium]|nr:hypothetical protein [Candidatus Omnitrophota bacterium]